MSDRAPRSSPAEPCARPLCGSPLWSRPPNRVGSIWGNVGCDMWGKLGRAREKRTCGRARFGKASSGSVCCSRESSAHVPRAETAPHQVAQSTCRSSVRTCGFFRDCFSKIHLTQCHYYALFLDDMPFEWENLWGVILFGRVSRAIEP